MDGVGSEREVGADEGGGGASGASERASECAPAHAPGEPCHPGNPHWPGRVVLHLDLDAFFAQVEMLDDPSLRGKPVVVGARRRPDGTIGRGVVSTASYEARAFGVHSAMPLAQAERLCPQAEFLPARFDRYRELGRAVFEVCERWSPCVDRVGIDEGYLDVTGLERWMGGRVARRLDEDAGAAEPACDPLSLALRWPTLLASGLKREVCRATGLTCSLGVAPTRFLAKIASDQNKPDGVTTVTRREATAFIAQLPITRLRGVGPVTARRLAALGYRSGRDLVEDSREHVVQLLGEFGGHLWDAARGIDVGRRHEGFGVSGGVHAEERKSISHETTFPEDVGDRAALVATLADLTARTAYKLRTQGFRAGCVSLKLRFSDFTTLTRDRSLADDAAGAIRFADNEADLLPVAVALLDALLARHPLSAQPVRLIGVRLSRLASHGGRQLRLGEAESFERRTAAARAADAIRARHGYGAITSAAARERPGRRGKG